MYTALLIMFGGFLAGRLAGRKISESFLRKGVMAAIFLLLFLLGAEIGENAELLENLPRLGGDALLLAIFCTGGSIVCSWLFTPLYQGLERKRSAGKQK